MARMRRPSLSMSLSLSEHMAGWIAEGDMEPEEAETRGRGAGTTIEHDITIVWEDGPAVLLKPWIRARVLGSVICPILSRERLQASGSFRLLVPDPTHVETWHMQYDLHLIDITGQDCYRLFGEKTISATGVYEPWRSTTTLPFHVTRTSPFDAYRKGAVSEASGVLHLSFGDLVRMLVSIEAKGGRASQRMDLVAGFALRFLKSLLSVYGGPLDEPEAFDYAAWEPYPRRRFASKTKCDNRRRSQVPSAARTYCLLLRRRTGSAVVATPPLGRRHARGYLAEADPLRASTSKRRGAPAGGDGPRLRNGGIVLRHHHP